MNEAQSIAGFGSTITAATDPNPKSNRRLSCDEVIDAQAALLPPAAARLSEQTVPSEIWKAPVDDRNFPAPYADYGGASTPNFTKTTGEDWSFV